MANFSGPTFELADDSPVRSGRKHRRGRGHTSNSGTSHNKNKQPSYSSNGGQCSNVASQVMHHGQTQYYTADWDSNPKNSSINSKQQNNDNNSCTGSLDYSASSSVQSGMSSGGESSNDSSFAEIIKLFDSEGDGNSEIKAFLATRSEAANSEGGGQHIYQGSAALNGDGAVAGWMQRVDERSRQHHQQKQQQQAKRNPALSNSSNSRRITSSDVDFNYSKDDSDEEDFNENLLETITGRDDELPRRTNISVTTQSQGDPFAKKYSSRPQGQSTPRRSGNTTPPPNSRHKRTSTPPAPFATTISRNNSHRSKSSSDGSWDTPTKSPPRGSSHTKPPHASLTPSSRRTSPGNSSHHSGKKEPTTRDLSEAVYSKFWMCGFTDALNFRE